MSQRSESVCEEVQLEQQLEADVVQEVLKSGTDLRHYSRQVERELKEVENKCIQDYIKESENIVSLHNQIAACDFILERMENMLLSFQSDLGSISSEIVSLQRKSMSMSQQLHNRQSVRAQLSQFIDDIAVPSALIAGIMDCEVTDKEFITHLNVLNHKISFIKEQSYKDVKACQDVRDIVEKLKIKAVTKIRAYMLEQISKFRKPLTNYQVPQNAMLKYKFLFEFTLANERAAAQEICGEYVDTMSKVYFSYFKSYSLRLVKLQYEENATKDDLMGIEETGSRGLFHKTSLKQKSTVFSIGNRGEVLTSQLEKDIIIPHSAQKSDQRFPFEALFRSEQYALVDNACREYLFISEFFMVRGNHAMELFKRIMDKTLNLLLKNLETYVANCYDMIALFLCIHLVVRYQLLCHRRAVPALDQYWATMQHILSQRFEYVFELNILSVKDCNPAKFNKEMKPHYITRRYAEFSAAVVSISESFPNETVTKLLAQLLEEVQCFVLRMAAVFPERKEQLIFLINNYDMVLSVLMERTRETSKEVESFREQLNVRSTEYVEEVLSPHFCGLIQFVKEGEALVEKGQADQLKKQESKSMVLVQSFCSTWKQSLEEINKEVLKSFSNFTMSSTLFQLALTQLVQYYQRFQKLLTPAARAQLTNIHHIMLEIKKYKTSWTIPV